MKTQFFIIWDTTHEGWLRVVNVTPKTCHVKSTSRLDEATGFTMTEIERYGIAKSASRVLFPRP